MTFIFATILLEALAIYSLIFFWLKKEKWLLLANIYICCHDQLFFLLASLSFLCRDVIKLKSIQKQLIYIFRPLLCLHHFLVMPWKIPSLLFQVNCPTFSDSSKKAESALKFTRHHSFLYV